MTRSVSLLLIQFTLERMRMNPRYLLRLGSLIVAVLAFVVWLPPHLEAEEQDPYLVGAILPLSGDGAVIGRYNNQALDLALTYLDSEERAGIALKVEDDGWQPARTLSAFNRLVGHDGAKAIIVLGSASGKVLAPLAERRGVVLVAVGASDQSLARGTEHVFTHWVAPRVEAELVADEIRRRGYERVATVSHIQEGVEAYLRVFEVALKERGLSGRIRISQSYPMDARDFRSFVQKLAAERVDAVNILLMPGGLSAFVKQARRGGFTGEFFGVEMFEDSNEIKAAGGLLDGAWYVSAAAPGGEFRKSYIERFKEAPGWAAANSYDVLQILARAQKSVGSENDQIAQYLKALSDYKGAAGRYSADSSNGFLLGAEVKVVPYSSE